METNLISYNRQFELLSCLHTAIETNDRAGLENWFDELLESIRNLLNNVLSGVESRLSGLIGNVAGTIAYIAETISHLVDDFVARVEGFLENIFDALANAIDRLIASLNSIFNGVISAIRDAINGVWDWLQGILRGIGEWLSTAISNIANWLENVYNTIKNHIVEAYEHVREWLASVLDKITNFFNEQLQNLTAAWRTVREAIEIQIQKLLNALRDALEAINQKLTRIYIDACQHIENTILKPLRDTFGEAKELMLFKAEVFKKLALGQYEDFDAFIDDLTDPAPVIGVIAGILIPFLISVAIAPAASRALEPALYNLQQIVFKKFRPTLLPADDALRAYFRNAITADYLGDILARQGYDSTKINALIEANRPLLSPGFVQELFVRGHITEEQHDEFMRAHGYDDASISRMKKLYWTIPTATDLIRMAVREAFSPEIAQRFGQYEDFPAAFAEWAKKIGINEEWAKRYWAAHWDLPSPQMGFEMLHRGIITDEELKMLLRALDVMPFWREKLIKLSYVPYTRVDVRRMYAIGILDENGVFKAYKELGYDDEKARNLTEFTVRYYSPDEVTELDEYKRLTRDIFIKAYKRGVISRDEAKQRLVSIGYKEEDSEFLLTLADAEQSLSTPVEDKLPLLQQMTNLILSAYQRGLYTDDETVALLRDLNYTEKEALYYVIFSAYQRDESLRVARYDAIRQKYVARIYSRSDAIAALGALNIPATEMNALLERWDIERETRTKIPSETLLKRAWAKGLLSDEEYRDALRGLGYDDKFVDIIVKLGE